MSLTTHFLRERYQRISTIELGNFLTDVLNDRATIEKQAWSKVTNRMYDESDAKRLDIILENKADKNKKIKYSVLLGITLDFQLTEHLKFLKNFVSIFKI